MKTMKATKITLFLIWVSMTLIGGAIDFIIATYNMAYSGVAVEPTTMFTLIFSILTGFSCLTIYLNKKIDEQKQKASQNKGLNSAKDKDT
jgi:hypothetical protein